MRANAPGKRQDGNAACRQTASSHVENAKETAGQRQPCARAIARIGDMPGSVRSGDLAPSPGARFLRDIVVLAKMAASVHGT